MSLKFIQINIYWFLQFPCSHPCVWWVKCKKRVNQNSIKEKLNQKFMISLQFQPATNALFFCGPTFSTVSSTLLYWSSQQSSFNVLIGRFKILAFLTTALYHVQNHRPYSRSCWCYPSLLPKRMQWARNLFQWQWHERQMLMLHSPWRRWTCCNVDGRRLLTS